MPAATRNAQAVAFRKHQFVSRILLLVYDGRVFVLATFLLRWKCGLCCKTFRNYPQGVLRYKHYLLAALLILSQGYLQQPHTSYRLAVRHREVPIAYAGTVSEAHWSEAKKAREKPLPNLAHSTLWQWLGFFAREWTSTWQARARRQVRMDAFDLPAWAVDPGKHAGIERRAVLIMAAQVLAVLADGKYTTGFETMARGP